MSCETIANLELKIATLSTRMSHMEHKLKSLMIVMKENLALLNQTGEKKGVKVES